MTQQAPPFNLILRVDRTNTYSWLWFSIFGLLLAGGILKLAISFGFGFFPKVLSFFLFLVIGPGSLLLLTYVRRLHFTARNRLELNEEGLFDFASFCEVGVVPIHAIAQIRFAHLWGIEFLIINFFPSLNPLFRKRTLRREIYKILFGAELWVPTVLFRMSRIDLESQLIHLDHLLHEKTLSGLIPPPEMPPSNLPAPRLKGVEVSVRSEKSFADKVSQPAMEPPPLTQVTSERGAVLQRVHQIKQQVRESNFDAVMAHLYLDHIAMFPALHKSSPDHLPTGVTEVLGQQQGTNYEEVAFQYKGLFFSCGLRRDIGESDEALLSIGVGGRVHLSLKVRVEIGELAPIEIESFVAGEWQQTVMDLAQAIDEAERRRFGQLAATAPSMSLEEAQSKTSDIEELKNRFGIDE